MRACSPRTIRAGAAASVAGIIALGLMSFAQSSTSAAERQAGGAGRDQARNGPDALNPAPAARQRLLYSDSDIEEYRSRMEGAGPNGMNLSRKHLA